METAILLLEDHLLELRLQSEMAKNLQYNENSESAEFIEKAKKNQSESISDIEKALSLLKAENKIG